MNMYNHFFTATSDYTAQTGEVTINDDDTRQCVSIPIREDSITSESLECFSFSITLSNTVNNLTVDPDETSICIVNREGKRFMYKGCLYKCTQLFMWRWAMGF